MQTEKTIFKKIIDGEIPCTKIYEDEQYLAFLDIQPVSRGHVLLIPKKEYLWIQDMPDNEIADIFIKAKFLIQKIKEALGCDYVQLGIVGKDVPHVHIHLIPRYFNDNLPQSPQKPYEPGEAEKVAEELRSVL